MPDPDAEVRRHDWLYPFVLPDGRRTVDALPEGVAAMHEARLQMLNAALDAAFPAEPPRTALDLGCNEGYFALALAQRGLDVTGVDIRDDHLTSARLMQRALGVQPARFVRRDVLELQPDELGVADVVLVFGLLQRVVQPAAILHAARAHTRQLCIVETTTDVQPETLMRDAGFTGITLVPPPEDETSRRALHHRVMLAARVP